MKSKKEIKTRSGGFSLIEVLLYIGLLTIFLFSLTNLFVASVDVRLETEANSGVEQDMRYLASRLRYDITQADSISGPILGGSASSLQLVRGGINYTYSLDGQNNFNITSAGVSEQLNSSRSKVTTVTFTRRGAVGGNNTISVNLTLESQVVEAKGPQTRTLDITYATR